MQGREERRPRLGRRIYTYMWHLLHSRLARSGPIPVGSLICLPEVFLASIVQQRFHCHGGGKDKDKRPRLEVENKIYFSKYLSA